MLDMFDVKSDLAFNLLCDHFKAAKMLLFADVETAKKVMYGKLRAMDGLQSFAGSGNEVFGVFVKGAIHGKGGTEALEAKNPSNGLLNGDSTSALKMLKARVAEHDAETKRLQAEAAALKKEWEKATKAEGECKRDHTETQKQVRELKRHEDELEAGAEEYAAVLEATGFGAAADTASPSPRAGNLTSEGGHAASGAALGWCFLRGGPHPARVAFGDVQRRRI